MFPSRQERFQVGARTESLTRARYYGYVQFLVFVEFLPDVPQRIIQFIVQGIECFGSVQSDISNSIPFFEKYAFHTILLLLSILFFQGMLNARLKLRGLTISSRAAVSS